MTQKFQHPDHYRPDIDGLRAIAVLAVVIFHAFPEIAPRGFVGVDVFFVISGYLISLIILKGLGNNDFSFRNFYAHRIRRIFPALLALLSGCLLIGWFVMTPVEYGQLGFHIAASTLFVENGVLLHETGYFDVAAELKPLLHLWSLSVEEQFYLFYPLLIWLTWKVRLPLLVIIPLLASLSLAINIGYHTQHPEAVFYLLHTRFWELLAGGLIAYLNLYKPVPVFNSMGPDKKNLLLDLFSVAGLLCILFAITRSNNNTNPDQLLMTWVTAVVGSCLLAGAGAATWINRHILANRLLVTIGLISYPLYLWHWSLLVFLRLMQRDHQLSVIHKLTAIALSFILAWITYQWIEKPCRYGNKSRMKTVILTALLLVTGLSGIYIAKHAGLPSRYPQEVRAIATYTYDEKLYARYGHCWFDREAAPDVFSPPCRGALALPSSKHSVLVWGDSHAAHLYPAIDELFGGKGDVAEFARSTCPPVLGTNTADCIAGNEYVLSMIKKHTPETVVMFAFWGSYADRWTAETPIAIQLLDTLHQLQSAGVKKIILIGPAPQWTDELPNLVLEETLDDAPRYRIPQRWNRYLQPVSRIADTDLKALLSQEKGVLYFSALDALCNADGCLVRTSADDPVSFTSYDYAHFTIHGARYVAKQLPIAIDQ